MTDAIDSVVFPMLGCKWFLRFRPNGLSKGQHAGNAFLILHCTGLPPNRTSINFRYKLSLLETKTTYKHTTTFHANYLNVSWDKGVLPTKSIRKLKCFTLKVSIELLAVYNRRGQDVLIEYMRTISRSPRSPRAPVPIHRRHKSRPQNLKLDLKSNDSKHPLKSPSSQPGRSSVPKLGRRPRSTPFSPHKSSKNGSGSGSGGGSGSGSVREDLMMKYIEKVRSLESEMDALRVTVTRMSASIQNIEVKLQEECNRNDDRKDLFDVQHDQYALVMMEVNNMKRAIAKLGGIGLDSALNAKCRQLREWFDFKVYPI